MPFVPELPEPLAEYVDLFVIGEAEAVLNPLIDRIKEFEKPAKRVEEFVDLKGAAQRSHWISTHGGKRWMNHYLRITFALT